ncbi:unnamed protein product [Miscanthus lutarioriparius]|uniref:Uncharacterized protein n=1 Tax=Miscanthus lutarioriparius TaxID=422564 RepID=A0A811SS37_9POAL|nr:unnamed protein product [Miscanthus lutarioriparius]
MATAAVVGVTTGVMNPLLSKLTKLLEEEYAKFKGVRKQIMFLIDELSAMSATLEMLADAEELNPQTRKWRDKLRELAYDLEDCIDAFMIRVDHEHDGHSGFIKRFFRKLKKLKPRHEIAKQIQDLKASVIEASERHKRYQLVDISSNFESKKNISSNSRSTCAVDPRLSALYVEIDKLVGIDGPKKYITEWLTMETKKASSSELKVLSIVGCGGLGKTTLANQVYKDVKSQFSCAVFVSVSRTPDVRKVLRGIAKGVGITSNMLDDDEKELIDTLREHLQDKRYLIVIDDVWDAKPWETIKLALMNNDCGSRVITTTRSNDVASYLSSQGGNVYQMKSLSFVDSKRLLFKRAFGSASLCYTHLGTAPDEILRKCDGLPLAIITISSMLADQHAKGEWDSVLNDIGSSLAKNPGAENMTAILSMSYFDIPHHLRSCLLYLSVFLEDHKIEKQCLISRWIAEGFIHKEKGQNEYEIGERYFNDLINRSMIQPVRVKYGQVKACQVHDIILDYIKCKAAEENFVTSLDAAKPVYTSEYKTLDVRGTIIKELPRTITELQQLTRLYVDWYTRFPEGTIGKMHSLEELRRPEDVEILGEIPSLLFLNLESVGGTGGRIVFPGNSGFRSLKYFSLRIDKCGTSLEFEAGSMPKLEHVKLEFRAHEMECVNGASSSLGIQHLSSLNKAEIEIGSDWYEYDVDYNPVEDDHDGAARCISRAINAAFETLPNRPTASFRRVHSNMH